MVASNSRRNSKGKSSSPTAACDRCRGQKLRCIWDPKEPQCQRCARANAVCTVPLPRPMGRPPRQYRSASSSSSSRRSRGQSRGLDSWAEESPTAPGSGEGAAADMPMTSADVLPHPLDFFPWVPEPDGLNLFAPGSAMAATPATAPAMPNLSAAIGVSRHFSPRHEAFAQALNNPFGDELGEADLEVYRDRDGVGDHMEFAAMDKGDEQIKLLTQLCELNVALFQHPLRLEKDKAAPQPTIDPANPTQSPTDAQSAESPGSPDLNLCDLGTGSLFEMTCRLKDIVTGIRALDEGAPQGPQRYDRPTALMALSCYTRLDVLYSRALEILLRARNSGQALNGTHPQMPELVIDGFSMGRCPDLQLNFLIHLHEQAGERIRSCIRSAEASTGVAGDRRDPNRSGQPGQSRYG